MVVDGSEEIRSPKSGEVMKLVGHARRTVKIPDHTEYLWIPIYYSPSNNRYHRALPDFLLPFKHYWVTAIADEINDQDPDRYSNPSDSTRSRWKKMAYDLLRRLSEIKLSVLHSSLPESLRKYLSSSEIDPVNVDPSNHRFTRQELIWLGTGF